jgi:hypothetical protein
MLLPARILALLVAAAALPVLAGCGEDEYTREPAAYPVNPPVGTDTTPRQLMGAAAANESAPAVAPPAVAPGVAPQQAVPPGEVMLDDSAPQDQYADTDPSALTDFRSTLDPYGAWQDDPTYGTVWVPSQDVVGSDFTPYVSAGHWTYDDEYTWVSDYDWGWAPFHYGRWVYASPYGWGWIPGRRYAGAWVSWRYGYGDYAYVGWGPMAPTWGWRGGIAVGFGFVPRTAYGFVGCSDLFLQTGLRSRMVGGSMVGTVATHTRPYSGASPTVNGRIGANPRVNGPPPSMLGIPSNGIAHGGSTNRGVMQAQGFAHPSTATAMGGHAPTVSASRGMGSAVARGYGGAGTEPSHFGGKLGSGFSGSSRNLGAGYGGYAYRGSSMGARPYYGAAPGSRGGFGGGAYGGGYGGGAFRGGYGGYGGGGYGAHPAVAPSGGGHHYESDSGGSGGYHSGGGGFRGGGSRGGGGGRGGGGRR